MKSRVYVMFLAILVGMSCKVFAAADWSVSDYKQYILGLDFNQLNEFLMKKDMRIANGYGSMKGKVFRIGHMGELTLSDVDILLSAIDEFLTK